MSDAAKAKSLKEALFTR